MLKKGDIVKIKNENVCGLLESERDSKWIVECVMKECCSVKNIRDIYSDGGLNINVEQWNLYKVSSIAEIARRYY